MENRRVRGVVVVAIAVSINGCSNCDRPPYLPDPEIKYPGVSEEFERVRQEKYVEPRAWPDKGIDNARRTEALRALRGLTPRAGTTAEGGLGPVAGGAVTGGPPSSTGSGTGPTT